MPKDTVQEWQADCYCAALHKPNGVYPAAQDLLELQINEACSEWIKAKRSEAEFHAKIQAHRVDSKKIPGILREHPFADVSGKRN